jgi:hypothetical protein
MKANESVQQTDGLRTCSVLAAAAAAATSSSALLAACAAATARTLTRRLLLHLTFPMVSTLGDDGVTAGCQEREKTSRGLGRREKVDRGDGEGRKKWELLCVGLKYPKCGVSNWQ